MRAGRLINVGWMNDGICTYPFFFTQWELYCNTNSYGLFLLILSPGDGYIELSHLFLRVSWHSLL